MDIPSIKARDADRGDINPFLLCTSHTDRDKRLRDAFTKLHLTPSSRILSPEVSINSANQAILPPLRNPNSKVPLRSVISVAAEGSSEMFFQP
jgi:hypothetical protein